MFEGSAEAAAKCQHFDRAMIEPEGRGLTLEACFQVYWTSPTPSQCRPVDPPPPGENNWRNHYSYFKRDEYGRE